MKTLVSRRSRAPRNQVSLVGLMADEIIRARKNKANEREALKLWCSRNNIRFAESLFDKALGHANWHWSFQREPQVSIVPLTDSKSSSDEHRAPAKDRVAV